MLRAFKKCGCYGEIKSLERGNGNYLMAKINEMSKDKLFNIDLSDLSISKERLISYYTECSKCKGILIYSESFTTNAETPEYVLREAIARVTEKFCLTPHIASNIVKNQLAKYDMGEHLDLINNLITEHRKSA